MGEIIDNDSDRAAKLRTAMKPAASVLINPASFDIGSLASKLEEHLDETTEAEKKKEAFDKKRTSHYKNEF